MTHKLTPLWCMLPESGLNWTAWLMKPSHEMYFMFTVTSTACSSSRTHFPPGLYSLYYHSHLSPYVFIHCTIIHTFPPCLYSLYYHSHLSPMSLFTVLPLTPFPLCLYSLYYHSHISPYVFIHCTITHTFPLCLYSLYYHSHLSPMSLFLYYHSHLSPYVFIHCTITHTFPPMSLFTVLSFTPYPLSWPISLFTVLSFTPFPHVFIHCTTTHTFPPMSLFTVLSLTPFPLCLYSLYYHSHLSPYHGLCLYSLYYHSHLSPYVFIHCTIIHTLPMSTFSFTVHEIQQVCRIFTNHKIHKVFLQKASFLSSPKHTLYTAISCSMSVCPTGWQYIYISSNSWITLMINPCRQNEVKG